MIERVRQSTNSVCRGLSKTSRVHNGSFDTYSIFSSTIGDEEFTFDNEVINTQVYRRVLNKASKAQVLQNADPGHELELFDEPLIDLSDEPNVPSVPTPNYSCAGSRWFGSFDGAVPVELPGDSAFVDSDNDRAKDQTSLGDTSFTQNSGHFPLSDHRSLESRFAEPSVAEESPFQANNDLKINFVASRTEQEKGREQFFNEDYSEGQGIDHEVANGIGSNKGLARGGRNQEAHFPPYQEQMSEGTGEQPPDLPNKRMTVQGSMVPINPPLSPDIQVSRSSNFSTATTTTHNPRTTVPGNTISEHTYEIAPSSPLIRPATPFPSSSHAHFSSESMGAVLAPSNVPISRHHSDASGYGSVRDLHTSRLPRRRPSLQIEYRAGNSSGVAISNSSQDHGWIAKPPDGYTDKSAGSSGFTHDHITPWLVDNGKPFPPTINMQSVLQAKLERSGPESHDFILSALIWLVDPDSYTIKDTIVSNSISETALVLLGSMSGKTSACKTYAAQCPEFTDYAALTAAFQDYTIRVPMILNRFGVIQESTVMLRDTGAELTAHEIDRFSRHADVILLCYPVGEGSFDNVSDYVGTYPYVSFTIH